MEIVRKEDRETIVQQRPSGALAAHARSIMQNMSADQLKLVERDMLFVKEPVTGANISHRRDLADPFNQFSHLTTRRNKFARLVTAPPAGGGEELANPVFVYADGAEIHRDNFLWRDTEFVIPLRLLSNFFAVNSNIACNISIKFFIEQDVKRLFEFVGVIPAAQRENTRPPSLQTIFYKTPKINYNLYALTASRMANETKLMSQLKGKRTGIQPVYHEKKLIIRAGGHGGIVNFNNSGTQFEWIIISVIPEISKTHRHTYATYANEQACYVLREIHISNIKD